MEEMIGVIKLFAGEYAPEYFAFCEGQILSIQQNAALFSVLGTQYGGDGQTTFGLPDLRPFNNGYRHWEEGQPKYIICLEGLYPSRP